MAGTTQASFPVRDVTFELDEQVPRRWHGNRAAVTLFFNNLSVLFPEGERFFIRSVQRYRKDVDDPELLAEVRAFTRQEGIHTREHESYNAMLRRQGYDVDGYERRVKQLLRIPRLVGPLRDRVSLAVTVSLEHWTAMFAHFVLQDDSIMADAHPAMAALWRWHAAEECEHKSVAFDVYERTGGGYLVRCATMLVVTAIFWARVAKQQAVMMHRDGIAFNLREWVDLCRFLVFEQRIVGRLGPIWLSYFAPRFHPWKLDDGHLLERWGDHFSPDLTYRRRVVQAN